MNHLELKNKVLSELQLISDMAIQDVKNDNENLDIEDFLSDHKWNDRYEWVTVPISNNKKLAEKKDELISMKYPHGWRNDETEDLISIDTFNGFLSLPINSTNQIHYAIKNGWGTGKVSVKNKTAHQLNGRSKELQSEIMKYREAYQNGSYSYNEYQGSYFGYSKTKTLTKDQVIEMYQRAEPGDLIRLCWRFITNPENLEGVHIAWSEDPKVTFEPYREISEMPKYLADKLQEVA